MESNGCPTPVVMDVLSGPEVALLTLGFVTFCFLCLVVLVATMTGFREMTK